MAARKKTKTQYTLPELGKTASKRPARVAEIVRERLAELMLRKTRDPRLVGMTVTGVDMTPDLRTAIIYFTCAEGEEPNIKKGLDSARGFLRSQLAKGLGLRYMPELMFKHDLSVTYHSEMDKLFKEIENERQSTQQDS